MATNLIEDAMNFGFGLFAYSREQIEKAVEKMVDSGKVERKDAQSFTHKMVEEGAQQRKDIQSMINSSIRENLEQMGITQNQSTTPPLTAEEVRQIVREELADSKK